MGNPGLIVQQEGEGLRQDKHQDGAGGTDDETEANGLIETVFHQHTPSPGGGLRNGGNEGDGQGIGDEGGKGDQRKRHPLQLAVQGRRRSGSDSGQGQALGDDDRFHRVSQGAEEAAGGDRNGDPQQPVERRLESAKQGCPSPPFSAAQLERGSSGILPVGTDQHHQTGEFTADDADHRAGGGVFDPVGQQQLGQN